MSRQSPRVYSPPGRPASFTLSGGIFFLLRMKTKDLYKPNPLRIPNRSEKHFAAIIHSLATMTMVLRSLRMDARNLFVGVDDLSLQSCIEIGRNAGIDEKQVRSMLAGACAHCGMYPEHAKGCQVKDCDEPDALCDCEACREGRRVHGP